MVSFACVLLGTNLMQLFVWPAVASCLGNEVFFSLNSLSAGQTKVCCQCQTLLEGWKMFYVMFFSPPMIQIASLWFMWHDSWLREEMGASLWEARRKTPRQEKFLPAVNPLELATLPHLKLWSPFIEENTTQKRIMSRFAFLSTIYFSLVMWWFFCLTTMGMINMWPLVPLVQVQFGAASLAFWCHQASPGLKLPRSAMHILGGYLDWCCKVAGGAASRARAKWATWTEDWLRHPLVFPLFSSDSTSRNTFGKSVVGISMFLGEGSAEECSSAPS